MQGAVPQCLTCQFFKGRPMGAKDKAKCSMMSRGIPNGIYFDGKKCSSYKKKV